MNIAKRILTLIFALLLLGLLIRTLQNPHEEYYGASDAFIFSKGNAPEDVRAEIIHQLQRFQEGYTKRDTSLVDPFMQELFSQENVAILGTMPNEIFVGPDEAGWLVKSDWESWGDCTFLVDRAHISTHGDVAWISTIGYVKFDICSLLVMPLRLSAVSVNEGGTWKFQQMQFQFDLDLGFILLVIVLLIVWSALSMVSLAIAIVRGLRTSKE